MAYYKLMPLRIPRLHSMGIAPAMRRARVTGGGKGSTHPSPFRTPHIGRRTGSSASRLRLHGPAEEKRVRPFENYVDRASGSSLSEAGRPSTLGLW